MARRKRGIFGWIIVLGVLVLAGVGVYTVSQTDTGKTTIKAAGAGAEAAAEVVKKSK